MLSKNSAKAQNGVNGDMMKELVIDAEVNKLDELLEFVDGFLEEVSCSAKAKIQLDVAIEEIFVNIASYAYGEGKGKAWFRISHSDSPSAVTLVFEDEGTPFDPLAKEDPDTTLSADKRQIGGLGILMVKKMATSIAYARVNDRNRLTIFKGA